MDKSKVAFNLRFYYWIIYLYILEFDKPTIGCHDDIVGTCPKCDLNLHFLPTNHIIKSFSISLKYHYNHNHSYLDDWFKSY
jgi:hypothetical protein